ncbi:hypothetical protein [Helicobacter sp. UBA3407]|uniref:hypothetical protein n=1 Tax=Helicobacter TaxID=209 RepID=UPI002618D465|nr:hypothetical protein [Helicobacter sp. UBA3407]
MNVSKNFSGDRTEYNKILALKKCYKTASKILARECERVKNAKESTIKGYCFYLPILSGDKWQIECFENGRGKIIYNIKDLQKKLETHLE